jgi:hypothetical protein
MHDARFFHNDLKWRNILVEEKNPPHVFFIDCPAGGRRVKWRSRRCLVKDLACLDKVGKYTLTRTQRLWVYKQYRRLEKLSSFDKQVIYQVLLFFKGRE